MTTKLNETNKIITCLIQSNPPVPHENKTWIITYNGQSFPLGVNGITDEYKVEEKVNLGFYPCYILLRIHMIWSHDVIGHAYINYVTHPPSQINQVYYQKHTKTL